MTHHFSMPSPFGGLCESVKYNYGVEGEAPKIRINEDGSIRQVYCWRHWMESADLLTAPLPEPYEGRVSAFQRLILVKALREDKIQRSIAAFVGANLGEAFAVSPATSMSDIYKDLDNRTPCIFVLSTGADPTGN